MISQRDKYYLIDTGYWISLISSKKGAIEHENASNYYQVIKHKNLIFPWPTYYEIFRDMYFNRNVDIEKFKTAIKGLKINVLDDAKYKERALKITLENSNENNKISLVDNIIKLIMEDKRIQIDVFVTVNKSDFWKECIKYKINVVDLKKEK